MDGEGVDLGGRGGSGDLEGTGREGGGEKAIIRICCMRKMFYIKK